MTKGASTRRTTNCVFDDGCEVALIGALDNIEKMADPRQMPPDQRFVVGDAALFVSVFRRPSCRLPFLPSVWASEAELSAVDLVGDHAFVECSADGVIEALQEFVDALAIAAYERGEQRLLIRSDGRSIDRSNPPEHDVTTRPIEQSSDMGPATVALGT